VGQAFDILMLRWPRSGPRSIHQIKQFWRSTPFEARYARTSVIPVLVVILAEAREIQALQFTHRNVTFDALQQKPRAVMAGAYQVLVELQGRQLDEVEDVRSLLVDDVDILADDEARLLEAENHS